MNGISIIVLTYNTPDHINNLLVSFSKINTYQPFEFIIIDHGTENQTFSRTLEYSTKFYIRHIKRCKNYSFSESCNHGAKYAQHPFLLFLNNDIIYTNDVIQPCITALEDSSIGIVGIRLDDISDNTNKESSKVQHAGIDFIWNDRRQYHQPEQIRYGSIAEFTKSYKRKDKKIESVPAVTGAFMACRKHDFSILNGFNEDYYYGLEDIDLCLRMKKNLKKKCVCINWLSLEHKEQATRKQMPQDFIHKNHALFKQNWENYIKKTIIKKNDIIIRINNDQQN